MFSTQAVPAGLLLLSNMNDEAIPSPENSPAPTVESTPVGRRISSPRPKKSDKARVSEDLAAASDSENHDAQPLREHEELPHAGNDWPEPDAESAGDTQSQTESAKRKRRRRKGKGASAVSQNPAVPYTDEGVASDPMSAESPQENRPRPHPTPQPPQRPKIDPELLTKMAWKIYLAEVSEEGVALIGDNDAKDLSRRCFRLAEIFIEEQSRRR